MNLSRRSFLFGMTAAVAAPSTALKAAPMRAVTTMDAGLFYAPHVPEALLQHNLHAFIEHWREYTMRQRDEINNCFFRSRYREETSNIFRMAQHQRMLYDYRIQCDETCNPPSFIDRGGFRALIHLQPNRYPKIITLKAEFHPDGA